MSTTEPQPTPTPPPGPNPTPPARWSPWYSAALVACAALIVADGIFVVPRSHLGAWAGVMVLLVLMTVIVGFATSGVATGALIDRRNRLSLARLQLLVWTILVSSSFYAAGMINVMANQPNPLKVEVPPTLWALMGLGMTSAIGAPALEQTKQRRPADPAERERTLRALAQRSGEAGQTDTVTNSGQLVINRSVRDARSADLLTGDEIGDAAYVDLGKLQLALTTMLGTILYAAAVAEILRHPAPIGALPALDNGLVTLLGISQLGFLGHLAVPKSVTPR